jgi:hypothetical protein
MVAHRFTFAPTPGTVFPGTSRGSAKKHFGTDKIVAHRFTFAPTPGTVFPGTSRGSIFKLLPATQLPEARMTTGLSTPSLPLATTKKLGGTLWA